MEKKIIVLIIILFVLTSAMLIIPLNKTSSSEFKNIGNGIYQYNLSIYYGQLTTNTTSSIKPLDISSYIYPIGIIIFVSFLGAMVYFSKSEGKKWGE